MLADEYHNQMMMGTQTPSRQDYCSDPYAAVQKPNKKRLDSHMGELSMRKLLSDFKFQFSTLFFSPFSESPYPVTGLPDPYMDQMQMQMGEDQIDHSKAPHMSLDYDETSGYSTPNSRNRRVIREIIV